VIAWPAVGAEANTSWLGSVSDQSDGPCKRAVVVDRHALGDVSVPDPWAVMLTAVPPIALARLDASLK
jgi:hypothetical protein